MKKKIVFLFPGQGSQKMGMGADLGVTPQGQRAFSEAQEILGYDLREICVEGPSNDLQRTLYTQPALYVVSSILRDLLAERGVIPGAVSGHSAGEYAALYSAGVFDFETGLRIVGRRAQLMDEAGSKSGGAMAAIMGMEIPAVEKLVSDLAQDGVLGIAGYNAEGQVVISGEKERVEQAVVEAKNRGARMAVILPVSGAFHSPLMKEASDRFAEFLEEIEFQTPQVPFVSNLTGQAEKDPEQIKSGLFQLLLKPVRWIQCLRTLASLRPDSYYEVGPGNVLAGLLKRFDRSLTIIGIQNCSDIEGLSSESSSRMN